MESKDLQKLIDVTFREYFGHTPQTERLRDIQREFFELNRSQDVNNLKEESGDLMASLMQLCSESGWSVEELILETLKKIERRADQYKTLGRKTKVAILGGAFNPIHDGHIQLAQFVLNASGEFDEVWLMPANNHMYNKEMASPEHRLKMCELAAKKDARIKVFDYEIKNNLKGETYYFFKRLKEEKELTEKYQFAMIIGLDNANTFDKWVNYQDLERLAQFVVVPRKGIVRDPDVDWYLKPPHIFLNRENNILEISSTYIRDSVKNYTFVKDFAHVDGEVFDYIKKNRLYTFDINKKKDEL
jgi:nicotinate-nucleotide adenylyltransferase